MDTPSTINIPSTSNKKTCFIFFKLFQEHRFPNLGMCFFKVSLSIGSMYGIFSYIYHGNQPNVGIYTMHGSYGYSIMFVSFMHFFGDVTVKTAWISPPSWIPVVEFVKDFFFGMFGA